MLELLHQCMIIRDKMIREEWIVKSENSENVDAWLLAEDDLDRALICISMVNFNESTVILVGGFGHYTVGISANSSYPTAIELAHAVETVIYKVLGNSLYKTSIN